MSNNLSDCALFTFSLAVLLTFREWIATVSVSLRVSDNINRRVCIPDVIAKRIINEMWICPRQCSSVNSKRITDNAFHLFTSCYVSSFPTTGSCSAFWHGLQCVACCHEFLKLLENVFSTKTKCLFPCFVFCTGGFKDRRGHQWQQATFLHFFKVLSNVKSTWIKLLLVDHDWSMCTQMLLPTLMCGRARKQRTTQTYLFSSWRKWEHRWTYVFCVNLHWWYWRAFYKH